MERAHGLAGKIFPEEVSLFSVSSKTFGFAVGGWGWRRGRGHSRFIAGSLLSEPPTRTGGGGGGGGGGVDEKGATVRR